MFNIKALAEALRMFAALIRETSVLRCTLLYNQPTGHTHVQLVSRSLRKASRSSCTADDSAALLRSHYTISTLGDEGDENTLVVLTRSSGGV